MCTLARTHMPTHILTRACARVDCDDDVQIKDLQAGNETLMREMKRILGETTPEMVGLSRESPFVCVCVCVCVCVRVCARVCVRVCVCA